MGFPLSQPPKIDVPEYEELEDEKLMALYINGDESAFRELFGRYRHRVYGYLSKRVRDQKLVEDLFQNVFFNLHRSRSSYEEDKLFSAWLFAICRNTVRSHLRGERRKVLVVPETQAENSVAQERGTGSQERMWQEVLQLITPKQKEAIRLRYEQELEFDEIAEQLQTTENNVRQMISRAVRKIRGSFP